MQKNEKLNRQIYKTIFLACLPLDSFRDWTTQTKNSRRHGDKIYFLKMLIAQSSEAYLKIIPESDLDATRKKRFIKVQQSKKHKKQNQKKIGEI